MEKHFEPGCYWVRFWRGGAGIHWRDMRRFPVLFSEREGFIKSMRIGNWLIKLLKPEPKLTPEEKEIIAVEQQMQMEDWQENDPSEDFLMPIVSTPASGPFTAGHYHYDGGRVTRQPEVEGIDCVCFCPVGEWLEYDANGYAMQPVKELREDLETEKIERPLFALDARRKLRVE